MKWLALAITVTACAAHAKGPIMSDAPIFDRVLKVQSFHTEKQEVIVTFFELPQPCGLSTQAPDFAKSVGAIAEGWRKAAPVHVKIRGVSEIVSVSGP